MRNLARNDFHSEIGSRRSPPRHGRWVGAVALLAIPSWVLGSAGRAGAVAHSLQATCPSSNCPYTAPTPNEQGFVNDVLSRINLERGAPQRDYPYNGQTQTLPALPEDPSLEQTAQAAAEYLAAHQTLEDYNGPMPNGEQATGANSGGPGGDSASFDEAAMESPGHAGAILSAAPDFAGVGVACDSNNNAWVVELFGNANQSAWQAGQSRVQAEQQANASGGQYPQQPIVAGTNNVYATGADWTCAGPRYAPGSAPLSPLPAPVTGIAATPDSGGYWLVNTAGAVSIHGDATFHGALNGTTLNATIAHIVSTPDGGGYWMVAGDGGVFCFGDAGFYGSMGAQHLNAPVVDLASTPDGQGYWLAATDGGVFAFGDAGYFGSVPAVLAPGQHLNAPVDGITAGTSGYRLVASDGGVFSFGDAGFYGSMGGGHLNAAVVGMDATNDGHGYWMVASDGGVFSFGDAGFEGSMGGASLSAPIVGMSKDAKSGGYWLVGSDGGVFAFNAPFYGAD